MDILLAAVCFWFVCCSYRVYRFFSSTHGPLPPGPRPLPVLGNLLSLGRLPHKSLHDISRTYGPIIRLSLGSVTTVVVSSPSLARDVLHTNDSCFYNRFVPDALTTFDHNRLGLGFVPVSPMFKTLRRIYNTHIISAKKLDGNWHLRVESLRRLVEEVAAYAEDGRAVNIGEAAFGTAFNMLANMVFSANLVDSFACSKTGELRELVTNILIEAGSPNIADYFPVLKRWDPQGSKRRMEVYFQKMFDVFGSMIENRIDARMERGWRRKDDVLETLLDLCEDKHEEAVDVVLLKHLFLDVFAAGTDTTSNTLEWALTELLRNPEKLSRAQSELRDVIDRGHLVKESDIPHLPFLQAVIKETLRLHPPAPLLLPRIAGEERMVGGYVVQKGTQVMVNVWGMGRDPSVWGKTAGEFIPERFLGSEINVGGHHFELVPFGGGRRICPGLQLGTRTLHVTLGTLVSNFDWKFEDGVNAENINMDERFGITIQKAQPLRAIPSAVA